jgi:hypothetical protein
MNKQTRSLATRIRNELPNVERALLRAAGSFKEAQRNADDRYLDSVALNLHGFYNGLKRLFELIASAIDRHVPTGENWHQVLLQQMSQETPNARPAVLRERTYQQSRVSTCRAQYLRIQFGSCQTQKIGGCSSTLI